MLHYLRTPFKVSCYLSCLPQYSQTVQLHITMRSCFNWITFLPCSQTTPDCTSWHPTSSRVPVAVPPSEYLMISEDESLVLYIALWHFSISSTGSDRTFGTGIRQLIAPEYCRVNIILRKEYNELNAQIEVMLSLCFSILCIDSLIKRTAEDDGNARQMLDLMGYGGMGCCYIRQTPLIVLSCLLWETYIEIGLNALDMV